MGSHALRADMGSSGCGIVLRALHSNFESNHIKVQASGNRVTLDWSELKIGVDLLNELESHSSHIDYYLIRNGQREKALKIPDGTTHITIQDRRAPGEQEDYVLEARRGNETLHQSELSLDESLNIQAVNRNSFVPFLDQNKLEVGASYLEKEGVDPELVDLAQTLGYQKTVYIVKPDAEPRVKSVVREYQERLDVLVHLNLAGEPEFVTLRDKQTNALIEEKIDPRNFFFKVDAAFNGNSFFWDDMLTALGTVYHHPWLVRSTVEFWLEVQKQNGGVIPREIRKENFLSLWEQNIVRWGEKKENLQYTNPYLLNWVVREMYSQNPSEENLQLLKRSIKSMLNHAQWIEEHRAVRDSQGRFIGFASSNLGSGMDNSPRGGGNENSNQFDRVGWVDMLWQQIAMYKDVSDFYGILSERARGSGNVQLAELYSAAARKHFRQARKFETFLERYYDPKTGFYYDLIPDGRGGYRRDEATATIVGFGPLFSRSVSPDRVQRLVEHLNPEEFGGEFPLPSLSRRHPLFSPEGHYWQGGHWISMATIVIDGFARCGRMDIAVKLAGDYLRALSHFSREYKAEHGVGTVVEFNSEKYESVDGVLKLVAGMGKQKNHKTRVDFFGWGKLLIYLTMKYGIGISPNTSGVLDWNLFFDLSNDPLVVKNPWSQGGPIRYLSVRRLDANYIELQVLSQKPIPLQLHNYVESGGRIGSGPESSSSILTVGGENVAKSYKVFLPRRP